MLGSFGLKWFFVAEILEALCKGNASQAAVNPKEFGKYGNAPSGLLQVCLVKGSNSMHHNASVFLSDFAPEPFEA